LGRAANQSVAAEQGPEISVVVPLYNEEENVGELYRRLCASLESLGVTFELVFVNDGSSDATPVILSKLHQEDPRLVVIHLSRNFGHQPAVCAGIDHACGKGVIVMDGDLQDPPEVLERFITPWRQGYEVVYAIRTKRKEGALKRAGYYLFYRLLHLISDLDIPLDSGDFCLLDRKVVEALKGLPERMRFVRGLRTFVGFRQTGVSYERAAREAGKPKYSFRALTRLAIDGLISFSSYPLRVVTYLGLTAVALSLLLAVWVIVDALSNSATPRGWASTLVVVLFMGAVQLISLGIIGEYIRRIFLEVKGRPTYIAGQIQKAALDAEGARMAEQGAGRGRVFAEGACLLGHRPVLAGGPDDGAARATLEGRNGG
jgi:dolichol-phosphate mannosyltransferase